MLKFAKFQWAAFLYWAVSYGGNIGGDQDYVPTMQKTNFLNRLRSHPEELTSHEIKEHLISFLNLWKCRMKDDDVTANAIKKVPVKFSEELSFLRNERLIDFGNLEDSVRSKIVSLYSELNNIPHFGPTATSKTIHVIYPDLFVMWDGAILKHYKKINPRVNGSGEGYVAFLSMMSQMGREVTADFQNYYPNSKPEIYLCEKLGYKLRKSLAKFIDEYNWITITKGISLPPQWSPQQTR